VNEFSRILEHLCDPAHLPAVLATLVKVDGSSYRRCGARLLVTKTGARLGSISGGCLEEDLLERARLLFAGPKVNELAVYDTTPENDLVWGVGLGCHGVVHVVLERFNDVPGWALEARRRLSQRQPVELWINYGPDAAHGTCLGEPGQTTIGAVYVDVISPPLALIVCGAGDDAQPLVRLADQMGWSVQVVDPRPALAVAGRFPEAHSVRCLPVEETSTALAWDRWTAVVIMTHHYRYDRPLLAQWLPLGLPYVGLLGPRQRAERLLSEMGGNGPTADHEARARLHAPVGLDLGGDGPLAVALSIVAEIQSVFGERDARPLRTRSGPIHHDEP
jgi:xanthine dehydrogenase accessory factor